MRRQIEGEIAWQRLIGEKIESEVTVGDDEVNAVIAAINASKGQDEYRVSEIFLPATAVDRDQVAGAANRLVEQVKQGASFAGLARTYSKATTAIVGGDLGWIRPERLPEPLPTALRQMQVGQVSDPIPVAGGFSILAVQDARKILTTDPRDSVLSLKQVALNFPASMTSPQRQSLVDRFSAAARNVGGCGGADRIAAEFNAEVVQRDEIRMRDLPASLQNLMLSMQIGQATQPFGSLSEGVRLFVICGRDQIAVQAPSFDEIYGEKKEERVNLRARRYLRDLRRDAIIEYR
jgi:peptidyl-prolyl cis-trans isomerase SurA